LEIVALTESVEVAVLLHVLYVYLSLSECPAQQLERTASVPLRLLCVITGGGHRECKHTGSLVEGRRIGVIGLGQGARFSGGPSGFLQVNKGERTREAKGSKSRSFVVMEVPLTVVKCHAGVIAGKALEDSPALVGGLFCLFESVHLLQYRA